jgi:hypothetical protein
MTSPPDTSHTILLGQNTCVMLSPEQRVIEAPADTYLFMNRGYSQNVFTVKGGQTTAVSPFGGEDRRWDAPTTILSEPLQGHRIYDKDPAEGLDVWTRYVRNFIAIYRLSLNQESQAWSVLKQAQDRALEYRQAHKPDYSQLALLSDLGEVNRRYKTLEQPVQQLFEDLKSRLNLLPTDAQREAVRGSPATQALSGEKRGRG